VKQKVRSGSSNVWERAQGPTIKAVGGHSQEKILHRKHLKKKPRSGPAFMRENGEGRPETGRLYRKYNGGRSRGGGSLRKERNKKSQKKKICILTFKRGMVKKGRGVNGAIETSLRKQLKKKGINFVEPKSTALVKQETMSGDLKKLPEQT